MTEDIAPPLPKGTKPGFYWLDLASKATTTLPKLAGYSGFRNDSKAVFHAHGNAGAYELLEQPLTGGPHRVLRSTSTAYGFSQVQFSGTTLVYIDDDKVAVGSLAGGPMEALTPKGAFAEYQWPQFSRDGTHVSYEVSAKATKSTMVASLTNKAAPHQKICSDCESQWYDENRLVVREKGGRLRLVGLDGSSVILAKSGELINIGSH